MNIKEYLEKLIRSKKDERDKLYKRIDESEDVKEIRGIGETLKTIAQEIADAEAQLQAIENEPEDDPTNEPTEEGKRAEDDKKDPTEDPKKDEDEPTSDDVKRSNNWVKIDETNIRKLSSTEIEGGKKMDKTKRELSIKDREERGKALKEGRSITVASDILLPSYQSSDLATAPFRQVSSFVDLTKIRNLQGGESYEAPFTKSYGEGGTTAEGAEYTEAETTFGHAKVNKVKITAYAEYSILK